MNENIPEEYKLRYLRMLAQMRQNPPSQVDYQAAADAHRESVRLWDGFVNSLKK
jgi:hypothetical protein